MESILLISILIFFEEGRKNTFQLGSLIVVMIVYNQFEVFSLYFKFPKLIKNYRLHRASKVTHIYSIMNDCR